MINYTLDTNALIYYSHGDAGAIDTLERYARESAFNISVITEIELFSKADTTQHEQSLIREMLRGIYVVSVDSAVGAITSRLRREHRMKLGDSIIAATAIFFGTTLLTRNVRDFKRIPGLSVEAI